MNKKTLIVMGLVIFVATLIFSFAMPVISGGEGSCCPEVGSICVIGDMVFEDQYAWFGPGPCPQEH